MNTDSSSSPTEHPAQEAARAPAVPALNAPVQDHHRLATLLPLCLIGGLLMGVANIVPGISGGAMLLLVGVYAAFIASLADLTSFRWRSTRPWLTVGFVGMGALTSIALLAGPVKYLIVTYRWEVFSVLIGMRLGVIPTVWRMARPPTPALWAGVAGGVVFTGLAALVQYNPQWLGAAGTSAPMLFLGGLIAASATILPGLDGSYLLIVLGQYVPILGAISRFKEAVLAGDVSAALTPMGMLVPFGLGAAIGIGGVSLVLRWLLEHRPKPTLGVLLGVLCGAFIGLYPFARYVPPQLGDTIKGVAVTEQTLPTIEKDDWPLEFFVPTAAQAGWAVLLLVAGFVLAILLARMDPEARKS